jgi:hypothetical protein
MTDFDSTFTKETRGRKRLWDKNAGLYDKFMVNHNNYMT